MILFHLSKIKKKLNSVAKQSFFFFGECQAVLLIMDKLIVILFLSEVISQI